MNSDPHDSTAWRSFGMLDSDETAAFDEAMRHDPALKSAAREMDRISAAVALATSHPVAPREGHLERIEARLGLQGPRRMPWWIGLSGWAAAAVLALLLAWHAGGKRPSPASPVVQTLAPELAKPPAGGGDQAAVPPDHPDEAENEKSVVDATRPSPEVPSPGILISRDTEQGAREIAALQDQLRSYQERERIRTQVISGVALPVIMKMSPPDTKVVQDVTLAMNDSPIFQLLGESYRATQFTKQEVGDTVDVTAANAPDKTLLPNTQSPPAETAPGAIPIYDAARDAGTLVVSNLPAAAKGREYNLWVQTRQGEPPVRLGVLPDAGTSPSESFDFSLGSNGVLPSGFILTQDPKDQPAVPGAQNTVLQSPQVAEP